VPPSLRSANEPWPRLPLDAWSYICATLHLWMQIAGKIRGEFILPYDAVREAESPDDILLEFLQSK
jgi:hypothetical protein